MRPSVKWWVGSSLLGLVVSVGLLALVVRDESVRRANNINGALEIMSKASIVLKLQLATYFALCLLVVTASKENARTILAVLGNLVLTSAAIYRLKVRRDMLIWSMTRGRRHGDKHP